MRFPPPTAAAALAAVVLTLAACGGDDAATTDRSDDPVGDATTTTLADDPVGDEILTTVRSGGISLDGGPRSAFVESGFDPEFTFDDGGEPTPALLAVYDDDGVVVLPVDLVAEAPTGVVIVVEPDGDRWFTAAADVTETDDGARATGRLARLGDDINLDSLVDQAGVGQDGVGQDGVGQDGAGAGQDGVDGGSAIDFDLEIGLGVGSSTFELDGDRAIVRGDLGSSTFDQVEYLIAAHPEVKTLVLQDIAGSVNDEVNVQTGRLVRSAGLATFVPADGEIYSGGVDLFAAGATRVAEPGATLGVHAWCCGPDGGSAHLIPQDDAAHRFQIEYFTEMLGPDLGPAFYFFTLQAAPFDGIEPMTRAEMDYFDLVSGDDVLAAADDADGAPVDDYRAVLGDDRFDEPADAAAALLDRVAERADAGSAEILLVLDGESTQVVIGTTDPGDGLVTTLTFVPDPDTGWALSAATEQTVCANGALEGVCR